MVNLEAAQMSYYLITDSLEEMTQIQEVKNNFSK